MLPVVLVFHYNDVIMDAIASQITSFTVVYSTVNSGADQRKHQSSASLAFQRRIHRWPVNSPHKWPVTRKMFPFDESSCVELIQDILRRSWFEAFMMNYICNYIFKLSYRYLPLLGNCTNIKYFADAAFANKVNKYMFMGKGTCIQGNYFLYQGS